MKHLFTFILAVVISVTAVSGTKLVPNWVKSQKIDLSTKISDKREIRERPLDVKLQAAPVPANFIAPKAAMAEDEWIQYWEMGPDEARWRSYFLAKYPLSSDPTKTPIDVYSLMTCANFDFEILSDFVGYSLLGYYIGTAAEIADSISPLVTNFGDLFFGFDVPDAKAVLDTMSLYTFNFQDYNKENYVIMENDLLRVYNFMAFKKLKTACWAADDVDLYKEAGNPFEQFGDFCLPNFHLEEVWAPYYGWGCNNVMGLIVTPGAGYEKTLLSNVQAYVSNGQLNVVLANDAMIQVYDMVGKIVATQQGKMGLNSLPLSQNGTYIVRAGKQSIKVIL